MLEAAADGPCDRADRLKPPARKAKTAAAEMEKTGKPAPVMSARMTLIRALINGAVGYALRRLIAHRAHS